MALHINGDVRVVNEMVKMLVDGDTIVFRRGAQTLCALES